MRNETIINSWDKIKPDNATHERILGNILDRVHSGETQKRKEASPMNKTIKWLAPVAACLVVALAIAIPTLLRNAGNPTGEIAIGEIAIVSKDLDIYYVNEQGAIVAKSVYMRCVVEDIYAEWAKLNGINDVSLVKCFYDDNGTDILHDEYGDPADPIRPVEHIYGDHITLHLTLSQEFTAYADGENGQLLLTSLKDTFFNYSSFDEFDLIITDQADSQTQNSPMSTGANESSISEKSFNARILELSANDVTVEPLEGEDILRSANEIRFSKNNLDDIGASVGDTVTVTYTGAIRESFPAGITATRWVIVEKAN